MRSTEQAFSLIELMISLLLSSFVILAANRFMLSNYSHYNQQQTKIRLHNDWQFSVDIIKKDIQQAGYYGCLSAKQQPFINNIADLQVLNSAIKTVDLSDIKRNWHSTKKPQGDILLLQYLDNSQSLNLLTAMKVNRSSLLTSYNNNFKKDDALMLTDCQKLDVFRVSEIRHKPAKNISQIFHHQPENNSNTLSHIYQTTAKLGAYKKIAYFTADNGKGDLALYRKENNDPADELVNNVLKFKLEYGIFNTEHQIVFRTKDQIDDWQTIKAMKINLKLGAGSNEIDNTAVIALRNQ